MSDWLNGLSAFPVVMLVLAVAFGLSVAAAILGAILVRMGRRRPAVVERASALSEKALGLVKRPLTLVVLDEVTSVIQIGHYTKNISDALLENHDELKALAAEKIREDPHVRLIGRLPGYDTIVGEVSEMTLRVIIEMLGDPRMDELVGDMLRNNLEQIKTAVRDRDHEQVGPPKPADPIPPGAPRRTAGRARRHPA